MKKTIRMIIFISVILLSAIAFGESSESLKQDFPAWKVGLQLQEKSMHPIDYSGFQLAICIDQIDVSTVIPNHFSDDGRVCYFELTDEECKKLLENALPVRCGPNGSVLWASYDSSLFIQHDHTLVLLTQAKNRGAEDSCGSLLYILHNEGKYATINGDARWSSDGRYLFINERTHLEGIYDPYLIDTYTGEVFLIETDGKEKDPLLIPPYQYIETGRFSNTDLEFYYVLRVSAVDHNTMDILKKYDLRTGKVTECYRTSNSAVIDFCEIGNKNLIITESFSSDIKIIYLSKSEEKYIVSQEEVIEDAVSKKVNLIPISNNMVLMHFQHLYNYSCLVPISWGQAANDLVWYAIRDLTVGELQIITTEEFSRICETLTNEYLQNKRIIIPGTSTISSLSVDCEDPSNLLCVLRYVRNVPDTWHGMIEEVYGLISINLNSMNIKPLVSSLDYIGAFPDQKLYSQDIILEKNDNIYFYELAEKDDLNIFWDAQQSDELMSDGSIYTCSSGTYICNNIEDGIVLKAYDIETSGVKVTNNIVALEDGYRVITDFTPEEEHNERKYLVPEALSEERFNLFIGKMSKSQQKKMKSFYLFVSPDKLRERENADELIKCYPGVLEKNMHILKTDVKDTDLERIEMYFAEAGYTTNDFENDIVEVNVSRRNDSKKNYQIFYKFTSKTNKTLSRTDVLKMAGLCDKINSNIYYNLFKDTKESDETSIESKIVLDILQSRTKEIAEYSGAAEPPVRCGLSHLSGAC